MWPQTAPSPRRPSKAPLVGLALGLVAWQGRVWLRGMIKLLQHRAEHVLAHDVVGLYPFKNTMESTLMFLTSHTLNPPYHALFNTQTQESFAAFLGTRARAETLQAQFHAVGAAVEVSQVRPGPWVWGGRSPTVALNPNKSAQSGSDWSLVYSGSTIILYLCCRILQGSACSSTLSQIQMNMKGHAVERELSSSTKEC